MTRRPTRLLGLVTVAMVAGSLVGESTIMARYMGQIAVWNTAIPLQGKVPADVYAGLPRKNFIDEHVWAKLTTLGIAPSEPAADSTFLRRVYLDSIGRLPTPDEARPVSAGESVALRPGDQVGSAFRILPYASSTRRDRASSVRGCCR